MFKSKETPAILVSPSGLFLLCTSCGLPSCMLSQDKRGVQDFQIKTAWASKTTIHFEKDVPEPFLLNEVLLKFSRLFNVILQ